MFECQTKAGNQISLSHSHSLSFTHSRHTEQLLFSCLCSKVTLSLSHHVTISMSHFHTLTISLSHSITLHMLNNFCFHVYAQKSLSHSHTLSFTLSRHAEQLLFSCLGSKVTVYSRKLQCFFWDLILSILTCYFRCHEAGSQLKICCPSLKIKIN